MMQIEPLEHRLLLSATLSSAGLLIITGTPGDDRISMIRVKAGKTKPAQLIITEKTTAPKANGSGTLATVETINLTLSAVKSILINAGDGNDSVSVAGGRTYHVAIPSTINGEGGNDSLTGGDANDILSGGAGDDLLTGGAGDDRIFGNEGKDRLTGGLGADYLNGGLDNDRLYAADNDNGADTVEGGGAHGGDIPNDYAVTDPLDMVRGVKRVKHPSAV